MKASQGSGLRFRGTQGLIAAATLLVFSCGEESFQVETDDHVLPVFDGKADGLASSGFPSAGDLALIIPTDDTQIDALELMPSERLDQVEIALLSSELGVSISDENWEEDWKLVSGRFVTCSPLGKVAERSEIDRLCWPQVRLVFQPVVEDLRVGSVIRQHYADDRAIHALFRVEHDHRALAPVLERVGRNARLWDIPDRELAEFEVARDQAGRRLLRVLESLRGARSGYDQIDVRPELNGFGDNDVFFENLRRSLWSLCPPEGLHELTAFSLPLGRNPASADLWSFVAFSGHDGWIEQSPLAIHDPTDGELLYAFPTSEDVTTGMGDGELLDALERMEPWRRNALQEQVVFDTSEVPRLGSKINDPYQTLVPNTSCSSCHRMTNLNFNFHNFSYFEDQGISVAPRVRNDVVRDVALAKQIWNRTAR